MAVIEISWGKVYWAHVCVCCCGVQVVFAVGTCVFLPVTRLSILMTGKVFFWFLYALLLLGIPLTIGYFFTIESRIDSYCAAHTNGCDAFQRQDLQALGYTCAAISLCVWGFAFSFFPRVVFVYLVAVERSHGVMHGPHSQLRGWIVKANASLPSWHRAGRAMAQCSRNCRRHCLDCSGVMEGDPHDSQLLWQQRHTCKAKCGRCAGDCCTTVMCARSQHAQDVMLACACMGCCSLFIVSLALCVSLGGADNNYNGFWCQLLQFFVEAFFNILSS